MKTELSALKDQYARAKNEKAKAAINEQIKALSKKDPDTFASVMVELARDTANSAEELLIREKLKDIIPAVSLSYIAKKYFGKTRTWIYHRINGSIVNGKPAKFNAEDIKILENAFRDLGNKLSSINVSA